MNDKSRTIVGVIQSKGGTGKSTVATSLAGELARMGETVLIDADMPQGTSQSWYALRKQAGKAGLLVIDTARDHQELIVKINQYQDARYIVVDGPPGLNSITRAMLVSTDLVLTPVGPFHPELWAASDLLALAAEANQVKPVNMRLLWTRYKPSKATLAMREQANDELSIKALQTTWGHRVAFVQALSTGLTAAETTDSKAKSELHSLLIEVHAVIR